MSAYSVIYGNDVNKPLMPQLKTTQSPRNSCERQPLCGSLFARSILRTIYNSSIPISSMFWFDVVKMVVLMLYCSTQQIWWPSCSSQLIGWDAKLKALGQSVFTSCRKSYLLRSLLIGDALFSAWSTLDFQNINGMEVNITARSFSGWPNFKVGETTTQNVTRPIFTSLDIHIVLTIVA